MKTIIRGKTIAERKEVLLKSRTPNCLHFLVKQRNGNWTDVWHENKNGTWMWNCNSSSKRKNGESYGCVMFNHVDKTKPYCSHTLAASILLSTISPKTSGANHSKGFTSLTETPDSSSKQEGKTMSEKECDECNGSGVSHDGDGNCTECDGKGHITMVVDADD